MVPPIGIEPMTRGFSVPCSTNWATEACLPLQLNQYSALGRICQYFFEYFFFSPYSKIPERQTGRGETMKIMILGCFGVPTFWYTHFHLRHPTKEYAWFQWFPQYAIDRFPDSTPNTHILHCRKCSWRLYLSLPSMNGMLAEKSERRQPHTNSCFRSHPSGILQSEYKHQRHLPVPVPEYRPYCFFVLPE